MLMPPTPINTSIFLSISLTLVAINIPSSAQMLEDPFGSKIVTERRCLKLYYDDRHWRFNIHTEVRLKIVTHEICGSSQALDQLDSFNGDF